MENRKDFLEMLFVLLPLVLGLIALSLGVLFYYIRQQRIVRAMRGKYLDDLENERQQISMEMHDIYGPYSMLLRNKVRNLPEIGKAQVDEIDDVIDRMSNELMLKNQELFPIHLLNEDFKTSLEHLATMLSDEDCAIDVTYEIDRDVPRQKKVHLYRVVQELIFNAIKHASPSFIQLTATGDARQMEFELYYPNQHGRMLKINRKRQGQSIIKERLQRIEAKRNVAYTDKMMTETISFYP